MRKRTCKRCGIKCVKKFCSMCFLPEKLTKNRKYTQIYDSIIMNYNLSDAEGKTLKAISQDLMHKCTHVACDLGLNLHDCPDAWQREWSGTVTGRQQWKTNFFAQMYGGFPSWGKSRIKGVTA